MTRAIKLVQDKAKARNKFLACLFLAKADRGRFKGLTDELANRFTEGKDEYPVDVAEAVKRLSERRGINTARARRMEDVQDGVLTSFQQGTFIRCGYCGSRGHKEDTCQKKRRDESSKQSTSFGKGQGNPWKSKGSGESSGKEGWFKDVRKETKRGVSGFQVDLEKKAWLLDED